MTEKLDRLIDNLFKKMDKHEDSILRAYMLLFVGGLVALLFSCGCSVYTIALAISAAIGGM